MWQQDIVNDWDFPSEISRHCHKRLVTEIAGWHDQREMFVKMSPRDRLDCLVDFVGMILLCLLPPCRTPSAPCSFTQLFFQKFLSHTLCCRLERISTTKNLSNLWCSKLQHVSTYAFCSWEDMFTRKWNCCSPNNLCKSSKSLPPLSSFRSIVWNFNLSWSNHLVTTLRLKMNVGHLSKHQNKPSDIDRHKGYFATRCVPQINVYTMRRIFEQRSKL